ncbi:MAG: hypothetical protein R6V47_06410, partial [Candidatus Delongbacteria bacterium]
RITDSVAVPTMLASSSRVREICKLFWLSRSKFSFKRRSNYDTAVDFASRGMKITFSSAKEDIFFLPCIAPKGYEFGFPECSTVSVFSGTDECHGVTLDGFKYGLKNQVLSRNIPLGLSNLAVGESQRINFENGVIVVIFNKNS